MLEYDRTDISEGIDVNKRNLSNECDICLFWYEMRKAMRFSNIAIGYVKENTYRIIFWLMSKGDAINIMNGFNLVDKSVFYKKPRCNTKQSKNLS